jgi:hypothetical protein
VIKTWEESQAGSLCYGGMRNFKWPQGAAAAQVAQNGQKKDPAYLAGSSVVSG